MPGTTRLVVDPGHVTANRQVILPGLEVQELGTIGLSLGDAQAVELANLCHPAPYRPGSLEGAKPANMGIS